ncbi:cation:proton antiporter [Thermogutta sp.]|uniref:cation:proton antiporter n=1 Tax=Thermogutta sp. TaxID=1962930 RepID=UPI00322023B9
MESSIPQIIVILLVGFLAGTICRVCRIPILPGYVLAGTIIGPSGMCLIGPGNQIEWLAEIGVVFLLFAIGIELSLEELRRSWRQCLSIGTIQVGFCLLVVAVLCRLLGFEIGTAIVVAMSVAVSSTVIVFRALTEWGYTAHPAGRRAIGILLFQDAAILPIMMWSAAIQRHGVGASSFAISAILLTIPLILAIPLLRLVVAHWIVPRLGRLRSTEIAVLFALLVLTTFGYVSHLLNLPVALGALAAGLVLNGNRMTKQLDALALPFRETFGAIFFISLGAYLNLDKLHEVTLGTLILCLLCLPAKAASLVVALRWSGLPWRSAVGLGAALLQMGELSFLLLWNGRQSGIVSGGLYNALMLVAVATLMATPILVYWGFRLVRGSVLEGQPNRRPGGESQLRKVVLIGAGPMGGHIAAYLETLGMDVCLIDQSPVNLQPFAQQGFRTICGDGRDTDVLQRAEILDATMVVVCVPDDSVATAIVKTARQLNPQATIIARCRYQSHRIALERAGANCIIVEEIEAAWAVQRFLQGL